MSSDVRDLQLQPSEEELRAPNADGFVGVCLQELKEQLGDA